MPTRTAHARWEGTIKEGKGTVDFGNGAFKGAYSFGSRFEDGAGTNPEELLGAAHAGCFAMALSLVLGMAGFTPDYIDATAHVTVTPQDGGFKITKSHIVCDAKVRHRSRNLSNSRRDSQDELPGIASPCRDGNHAPGHARVRMMGGWIVDQR